jgi:hypothetical protein
MDGHGLELLFKPQLLLLSKRLDLPEVPEVSCASDLLLPVLRAPAPADPDPDPARDRLVRNLYGQSES